MVGHLVHGSHTAAIYALAVDADGAILSGGGDGRLLSWQPARPDEVRAVATFPSAIQAICAVGKLLFVGTAAGDLFVIDRTSRETARFAGHSKGIFSLLHLNAQRIVCAGGDGALSLWTINASARIELHRNIPVSDKKLRGLARAGDHLAVACGDGLVRVLEMRSFNEVATCTGHSEGANALAFHPNKPVLLSGGKDGHVRAWDVQQGYRPVLSFAAHRSTIYTLAFGPDGRSLASASRDKSAKIWNADSLEPKARLDAAHGGHTHSVNACCWAGGTLFTGGDDRKVIRWSVDQNG